MSGCLCCPFALVAVLVPIWRGVPRGRKLAASAFLVTFGAALLAANHVRQMPGFGNVLDQFGLGPLTLRDTFILQINLPATPLWLEVFWALANGLGVLAAAAAVGVAAWQGWQALTGLWRHEDRQRVWLSVLIIALAGGYGLALLLVGSKTILFDRYFLPFAPLVCTLAVVAAGNLPASVAGDRAGIVVLVVLGLFSIGATHDYLAWNRARWAALNELTATGVDAKRIDGGYEFNGWFNYDPDYVMTKAKSWWWVTDDEYVIASGPIPGYRVEKRFPFVRWLLADSGYVVTLHRDGVAAK